MCMCIRRVLSTKMLADEVFFLYNRMSSLFRKSALSTPQKSYICFQITAEKRLLIQPPKMFRIDSSLLTFCLPRQTSIYANLY